MTTWTYDQHVLADNPTFYAPLDEPSKLAGGAMRTGAGEYWGDSIRAIEGPGLKGVNTGARFNEASGFTTATQSQMWPADSADFSCEFWFRGAPVAPDGITDRYFFMLRDTAAPLRQALAIYEDKTTGSLFAVRSESTATPLTALTGSIRDGQWHYVAVVFGGTDLSLYVDGALASDDSDATPASMGSHSNGNAVGCVGAVDVTGDQPNVSPWDMAAFAWYRDVALTPERIAQRYEAGLATAPPPEPKTPFAPDGKSPSESAKRALLAVSSKIVSRVDIFEGDGVTPYLPDVDFIDGSVSVDATRKERRVVDLTISTTDPEMTHASDRFWYDKVLKVYRGVEYEGLSWPGLLGTFKVDTISAGHLVGVVKVTGRDWSKSLAQKFGETRTYAAGSSLENIVRQVCEEGGLRPEQLVNLPDTETLIEKDLTYTPDAERWSSLVTLAEERNWSLYFDEDAQVVLERFPDYLADELSFDFQEGEAGSLNKWDGASADAKIRNKFIVTGQTATEGNVAPVGIAENNNPRSSTSIQNIGLRVEVLNETTLSTDEECQALADRLLIDAGLEAYDVSLETAVLPWLTPRDIVGFGPDKTDNSRYVLESFTIPLRLGTMSAKVSRLGFLPAAIDPRWIGTFVAEATMKVGTAGGAVRIIIETGDGQNAAIDWGDGSELEYGLDFSHSYPEGFKGELSIASNGLVSLDVEGAFSPNYSTLPRELQHLFIRSGAAGFGSAASLPPGLQTLWLGTGSTLSGQFKDLPTPLSKLTLLDPGCSLGGQLDDLNLREFVKFIHRGLQAEVYGRFDVAFGASQQLQELSLESKPRGIWGELEDMPDSLESFDARLGTKVRCYTSTVPASLKEFRIHPYGSLHVIPVGHLNNILIGLDANGLNGGSVTQDLTGAFGETTSLVKATGAGLTAKNNLISKGWTIQA